eukprot:TRINITY_DN4034_c0_g2_i1.p1 TRINITY_DN4034_c0_g2~~TRINITY_DN4034_c0_g2_i1.p1  ORF type:complete len:318 (+),score=62.61 TRINITY_DN4034_c0_g2_i1:278-1231(+)
MRVREVMLSTIPTIGKHFNRYINTSFATDVRQFYGDYFSNTNYYIYFPFLRNSTVNVRHKLVSLRAGHSREVPVITAMYVRSYALANEFVDTESPLDYMKIIDFGVNEVIRIFTSELRLLKNITLRGNHLPADGAFKLDARSFARIFPDLLFESNDNFGTLTFNGMRTNIEGYFTADNKSLHIENAVISIRADLSPIKTHLFKVLLNLSGEFEPWFYHINDNSDRLFMGLRAKKVNFAIESIEKGWDNQYAMINKKGLHKFLYDMINSYFIALYSNSTLGSGILISYSLPVAVRTYKMQDKRMLIYLDQNKTGKLTA